MENHTVTLTKDKKKTLKLKGKLSQLRLWESRLGRWLNPDPGKEFHSPYLGIGNNPVKYIDKKGDSIFIYSIDGTLQKIHDNVLATQIGADVINEFANSRNRHLHVMFGLIYMDFMLMLLLLEVLVRLWFKKGKITESNVKSYMGGFENIDQRDFIGIKI